jgi:hypothetical protein
MLCVADEKIVLIPVTRAMLIIIAGRDRPRMDTIGRPISGARRVTAMNMAMRHPVRARVCSPAPYRVLPVSHPWNTAGSQEDTAVRPDRVTQTL